MRKRAVNVSDIGDSKVNGYDPINSTRSAGTAIDEHGAITSAVVDAVDTSAVPEKNNANLNKKDKVANSAPCKTDKIQDGREKNPEETLA